jgi:hypothetical protein
LQRFFSATLQNFATQSLLMAIGVGARKALAASAAINWMLKDGMNRLVRMGVATQFGDSFDSDLKVGGAGLTLLEGVSVSAFDPVAVTNDWPAVALLLLMMCWPAHVLSGNNTPANLHLIAVDWRHTRRHSVDMLVHMRHACMPGMDASSALMRHSCCCCCPVMQRFRFTTSVMYTVCVSCEFLTPRFPSHFLLLTAVSNVGRAVGLTTFVSTQPAFQQALCASGNMADLASKTQVGVACADRVLIWCTHTRGVCIGAGVRCDWQKTQHAKLALYALAICGPN